MYGGTPPVPDAVRVTLPPAQIAGGTAGLIAALAMPVPTVTSAVRVTEQVPSLTTTLKVVVLVSAAVVVLAAAGEFTNTDGVHA